MQIRFRPEAEIELAEARLWYSLQREGFDTLRVEVKSKPRHRH
jgi:hypothetical protein